MDYNLKVLFVCSGNKGKIAPFILEQANDLIVKNIDVKIFIIEGKGVAGYLSNLKRFKREIKLFKPNIVHAHYGFSGLFANIQRKIPVITTFHGSDINDKRNLLIANITLFLSAKSITVNTDMAKKLISTKKVKIIPCGVNIDTFDISNIYNKEKDSIDILFSSSFDNQVKNYPLARSAVKVFEKLVTKKVNLIELKGYTREQVNQFMNTVDCVLLTSFSEGSPQFIKEAMACGCPAVSTNVGDVVILFKELPGYYISEYKEESIAVHLMKAIECRKKFRYTEGRDRILKLKLDNRSIIELIIKEYRELINYEQN